MRAIALAGPTAAGKTAAAMAIAQVLPVEIVSVDSALVYRGMDIGTAKPTAAERAAVPHHLIDILDPRDAYSAAGFVADANRLIDEIASRGRVPLLTGGTMLYFKALTEGLDTLPVADATVRAAIDAQADREGWPALHAELATVDPVSAARLAPNDAQRVQRALEVYRLTGEPLSAWHGRSRRAVRVLPLISLEPVQRGWLHERIATRFDAMLAAGFVDEVRALKARRDLHADLPSMRCVGYRQIWQALDDAAFQRELPTAMTALRDGGIAATRQLAKRQLTWLRGMQHRHVVAADAPDAVAQVVALALTLIHEGEPEPATLDAMPTDPRDAAA